MSKLGRHERTIRLPDEEPWQLPPSQPEQEPERTVREPAPAPQKERELVPAQR